jgi:hypothetical protein
MKRARFVWLVVVCAIAAACLPLPETLDQPGDEGRKNLEAIRAILAQYPTTQRSPVLGSTGVPGAEAAVQPATVRPGDPTFIERPSSLPHYAAPPALTPSSSKNLKVTIPWRPPSPDTLVLSEPFHPVPPYFHSVPIAPAYPDTLRCVPDLYGDQRCR